VAQVIYSPQALDQLERLMEFLLEEDPSAAASAKQAIVSGVDVVGEHPLVGRHVAGEIRELLISFGHTGYAALYHFVPAQSLVRVLGFRHQRELHYPL
jgi:plasmid stabilization system protein ParE